MGVKFEPRISGVRSNRSVIFFTTSAPGVRVSLSGHLMMTLSFTSLQAQNNFFK